MKTAHPLLIQLNTRLLLHRLGARATLRDIPDDTLDNLTALGADWVYLLGVWQLGQAAPAISRADPALLAEGRATMPGFVPADITGSCFAITGYDVSPAFGGDGALADLRTRLNTRGLQLMLDFITNHTAPDHPWARATPDLFINDDEARLASDPRNWRRIQTEAGDRIIALGRDPYFDGWPDTLQLDYANPLTRARMAGELARVAARCDGVRADMAMLVLPDIFQRTWGRETAEFWPEAIDGARRISPGFTLLAEVYWGLEAALRERGFDYTYDKTFYDALIACDPARLRALLGAPARDQARMARFLENHDEPRAASLLDWPERRAATTIAFLSPGLRFLHQGQIEGARIHNSVHFARGPDEPVDHRSVAFHRALLALLPHEGMFTPLSPTPAWLDNPSHDAFVVFLWREALLVCVNFSAHQAQCRVSFDAGLVALEDQLGPERYERDSADLFLDLPPWGVNVFKIGALPQAPPKASLWKPTL